LRVRLISNTLDGITAAWDECKLPASNSEIGRSSPPACSNANPNHNINPNLNPNPTADPN